MIGNERELLRGLTQAMATVTEALTEVKPARIGYFTIRGSHDRNPLGCDENMVLPICSTCNKPITDFKNGLLVLDISDQPSVSVGNIDDYQLRQLPVVAKYYFHKGKCDVVDGDSSIELDTIFKSDPRKARLQFSCRVASLLQRGN